ncbi:hypothetical protein ID866_5670 [Astraeus odoratus]|nr:hypothetical protein ID866_5670 [Astraeus odoratus]
MAQTTLARFHGDTVFGIVTRIFSTFVGGLLGTTMWSVLYTLHLTVERDFYSVVEQLEPVWAQAFLKRTRLLDSDFQGDVLAVISLVSSSLRNGSPLPQVSPCPLLDRFMERSHGFNVIHQEEEEDLGLPKNLTLDTLESLQYLTFCVGVCTAFSIMSRLDRLMIATKELVGEQYHIDGVGLPLHQIRRPTGIELRTPTLSLRQGQLPIESAVMAEAAKLNYIKVTKTASLVAHVQLTSPAHTYSTLFCWTGFGKNTPPCLTTYGSGSEMSVLWSCLPHFPRCSPRVSTVSLTIFISARSASSNIRTVYTYCHAIVEHLRLISSSLSEPARTASALREHILSFQAAISAPERCPVPVIVAIHGIAYGLAVDIVTACDIRYAASDVQLSIKEVDAGLAPDIGTLARLRHVSSNSSLAAELVYTARTFSAEEALELGIVSRVVKGGRDEVVREALQLAEEIARKSPVAVTGTKRLLMHARDHSVAENLEYTATWNAAMLQTEDVSKAVRAIKSKEREQAVFEPLPSSLSRGASMATKL